MGYRKQYLIVTLPKDCYFNCGIDVLKDTISADTNDSSNDKTVTIPLPKGIYWRIAKQVKHKVILKEEKVYFQCN